MYTNPNIYNTWLAPYGDWMKEWPLWVAQYYNEPNRDRKPILPRGVDKWALWQYSADTPPNRKGKEYGRYQSKSRRRSASWIMSGWPKNWPHW